MPRTPPLARYHDRRRRPREVIALTGATASLLLVDRDACTGGDCRLLAHLDADEPARNVALVLRDYLHRLEREPLRCRRLRPEDLKHGPADDTSMGEVDAASTFDASPDLAAADPRGPVLAHGVRFELHPRSTGREPAQLRWWRCESRRPVRPVSMRDAVGALESYEPIRSLTQAAIGENGGCCAGEHDAVSVSVLRAELKRLLASPIVLNRALREAVLERVERGDCSASEVAIRCGRVKHDCNGNVSGETSWLGRRLGLLPEGGKSSPTPWIHSDVLALIARSGLGIAPREVEL
jgi:hypothetical protein